ncbi:MAG: ribose-phosphate pyrophosphokinase [Planctomycetes bacterium]|nr:ribose-phosphate pyrophosphokinase [Planctomycetota bacterium]
MDKLKVFAGSASARLAEDICEYLGVEMGKASVGCFPDGETSVKILDDVRGCDVFVVQSTCTPVNDHLMELLILMDCARRASASRITAVIPYYGYGRQDRKDEGRVPITAKLVANMVAAAGADRVLTIDLHASQIQGFFDIPLDHLFATPILGRYYKEAEIENLCVVSPDVGSLKMANAYAKMLGGDLAIVEKIRIDPNTTHASNLIGNVKGKNALLIDEQISTGGTIAGAAQLLKDKGARDIHVGATHAVFCDDVVARLGSAPITEIAVTDTIELDGRAGDLNVRVLTVARFLGEAMRRIHFDESVSILFNAWPEATLF